MLFFIPLIFEFMPLSVCKPFAPSNCTQQTYYTRLALSSRLKWDEEGLPSIRPTGTSTIV
ncbi:hypothetical protein AG1IA_07588 [Rhizoctonia solani AG-1 IA]|uniref:Uncharacterized protein n=1 Tax=Thanatephorus cucumeris (strain AG1-IA) TaxID=983506 RepID=L8WNM6_THACA|nr:hypothetical protein AG1IA_07588 [Rhizoctonia solani AG-1 IA]